MQHSAEECGAVARSETAGGKPSVSKYSSGRTDTAAAAAAAIINGRRTSQLIKRLPFPVPPPPVSLRLNRPRCLAAPSPRAGHGFPQRSSLSSCYMLSCRRPQTLSWGHGYIKTTQRRPDFVTLIPHPTSWEMVRMWREWQPCLWWLSLKKKTPAARLNWNPNRNAWLLFLILAALWFACYVTSELSCEVL